MDDGSNLQQQALTDKVPVARVNLEPTAETLPTFTKQTIMHKDNSFV